MHLVDTKAHFLHKYLRQKRIKTDQNHHQNSPKHPLPHSNSNIQPISSKLHPSDHLKARFSIAVSPRKRSIDSLRIGSRHNSRILKIYGLKKSLAKKVDWESLLGQAATNYDALSQPKGNSFDLFSIKRTDALRGYTDKSRVGPKVAMQRALKPTQP